MSVTASATHLSTPKSMELRPPFDPALLPGLEIVPSNGFDSVESIRKISDPFPTVSFGSAYPDMDHTEYTIPGPEDNADGNVVLSVFRPKAPTSVKRAGVYCIHGGGQIAGNRFTAMPYIATWFAGVDVVLVTVEYRLSPEHPAPAALNDSYCGLVWVADNAAMLGIDPSKLMVQGLSGGGPIAAACAILARNHQYPKLCAQLLCCPMLDDRGLTVSSKQYEEVGPWDGKTNRMAWDYVLGVERGGPNVSELVAPARATDLAGVAPAFIDVGDAEVFRDEDVAYASNLWRSGVSAELHVWPGCYHGFEMAGASAPVSKTAASTRNAWINRILGGTK